MIKIPVMLVISGEDDIDYFLGKGSWEGQQPCSNEVIIMEFNKYLEGTGAQIEELKGE